MAQQSTKVFKELKKKIIRDLEVGIETIPITIELDMARQDGYTSTQIECYIQRMLRSISSRYNTQIGAIRLDGSKIEIRYKADFYRLPDWLWEEIEIADG